MQGVGCKDTEKAATSPAAAREGKARAVRPEKDPTSGNAEIAWDSEFGVLGKARGVSPEKDPTSGNAEMA